METMERLSALGEAAVDYAAQGWRVFPLAPRGKIPLTKNGLKDATTDVAQVREWWTKTPEANIGFGTGDGVQVVDIDGEEGAESLQMLEAQHGQFPETRRVRTGAGWHYYFRYDGGDMGNSASKLGLKIDTRGDGGYVILPPSIHASGALYEWSNSGEMAYLPEWVSDELRKRPSQWTGERDPDEFRLADPTVKSEHSYGVMHPYISAFFPHECHELARMGPGTGRNNKLNELAFLAGRIVAGGLANAIFIEDMVMAAARQAGLGGKEAEKTWNSGYQSGWLAQPYILEEEKGYNAKSKSIFNDAQQKKRQAAPQSLVITKLSDVKREHIDYLWGYRMVQNGVNLLVGDGGLGKSALALHIARAVTNGVPLPDDQGQGVQGSVLMASYEDPPDLVRQRARVLGIDLDKFYVLEGYHDEDGRLMPFSKERVVDLIAALDDPQFHDVRMMIVDPWGRYLDDDDNSEKLIRRAIAPLEELARKKNVTILILGHTNKSTEYTQAIHRISGHNAFKNVARSVLMVGKVTDEAVAVGHVKHNWSSPAKAVLYSWDRSKSWGKGESPLIWGDVTNMDVDELFSPRPPSKVDKAAAWLQRELIGGPRDAADLKELAKEEGHAESTLKRAYTKLGVLSDTHGNQYGRATMWRLPGNVGFEREPDPEPMQSDHVPAPPPIERESSEPSSEVRGILDEWATGDYSEDDIF